MDQAKRQSGAGIAFLPAQRRRIHSDWFRMTTQLNQSSSPVSCYYLCVNINWRTYLLIEWFLCSLLSEVVFTFTDCFRLFFTRNLSHHELLDDFSACRKIRCELTHVLLEKRLLSAEYEVGLFYLVLVPKSRVPISTSFIHLGKCRSLSERRLSRLPDRKCLLHSNDVTCLAACNRKRLVLATTVQV